MVFLGISHKSPPVRVDTLVFRLLSPFSFTPLNYKFHPYVFNPYRMVVKTRANYSSATRQKRLHCRLGKFRTILTHPVRSSQTDSTAFNILEFAKLNAFGLLNYFEWFWMFVCQTSKWCSLSNKVIFNCSTEPWVLSSCTASFSLRTRSFTNETRYSSAFSLFCITRGRSFWWREKLPFSKTSNFSLPKNTRSIVN